MEVRTASFSIRTRIKTFYITPYWQARTCLLCECWNWSIVLYHIGVCAAPSAPVAQLIEHLFCSQMAGGLNPSRGSMERWLSGL